jgi:AraC family transcriptional regulator, transcriptional activator FtrA
VLSAWVMLDGRSGATHWRLTAALAHGFPRVQIREDVLYVDAGGMITSAGSATGMDMVLHLARKEYGAHLANLVTARLVLTPRSARRESDRRPAGRGDAMLRQCSRDVLRGRIASLGRMG